jgi:hypothetical protein
MDGQLLLLDKIKQSVPLDHRKIIQVCYSGPLISDFDGDLKTQENMVKTVITKAAILSNIKPFDVSNPNEMAVFNNMVATILKHYRSFTVNEMTTAFEFNLTGELTEDGSKVNHFQSFTFEFFSEVMKSFRERKARAFSVFNRAKPSMLEEPEPMDKEGAFHGLVNYRLTNGQFPFGWDWNGAFKYMWKNNLMPDDETMKDIMADMMEKKRELAAKKMKLATNLKERKEIEEESTEDSLKTSCRKEFVINYIEQNHISKAS